MRAFISVVALFLAAPVAASPFNSSERAESEEEAVSTVSRVGTQGIARGVGQIVGANLRSGGKRGTSGAAGSRNTSYLWDSNTHTGLSAGDYLGLPYTAWVSANYLNLEVRPDGRSSNNRKRKTELGGVQGGLDVGIDNWIFGVALGYAYSVTDGRDLAVPSVFEQEAGDFTVAPYVGVSLNDNWSLDALVGYTWTETDNDTRAPNGGAAISTYTRDSDARFGSFNVNYYRAIGPVDFSARLGAIFIKTKGESVIDAQATRIDSFDEPHWTASFGMRGEYPIETGSSLVTPFAELAYERDRRLRGLGENALRISGGLNLDLTDNFRAGVEANTLQLKNNQDEFGVAATLNWFF